VIIADKNYEGEGIGLPPKAAEDLLAPRKIILYLLN